MHLFFNIILVPRVVAPGGSGLYSLDALELRARLGAGGAEVSRRIPVTAVRGAVEMPDGCH